MSALELLTKLIHQIKKHRFLSLFVTSLIFLFLIFLGNKVIYNSIAFVIYGYLMMQTYLLKQQTQYKSMRAGVNMIFACTVLVCLQYLFFAYYSRSYSLSTFVHFVTHWMGIGLLVFMIGLEKIFILKDYTAVIPPKTTDAKTIQFFDLNRHIQKIRALKEKVTFDTLQEILLDLPRHSPFEYVNEGSLTEAYFEAATASLEDPYIYIIVSNTGSPASDIISIFTQKSYNHASLSFDKDLDTIISYNGGEKVSPPGLNQEMLEFFNKKDDASIIVYRLAITREKKEHLIHTVKKINTEGSAYNLIGLMTPYPKLPNIMFCSQFVYGMLKEVDLAYFDMDDDLVKPTDLIEMDYYRKLEFCYEVYLNDAHVSA